MNKSLELQLIEKIKELEVVQACCHEGEGADIEIRLQCYRDTLIMYRKNQLCEARVSQCELGWMVHIGESDFLVQKVTRDAGSGYDAYLQHATEKSYYKLLSNRPMSSLSDAVSFLQTKYKEGLA